MKMLFVVVPGIQLFLASATYAGAYHLLGQGPKLDAKFTLIKTYELGYVYLAVSIIALGRARLVVNANANRAAARVDRPDQHVYKTMDSQAQASAPLVLMANTGDIGRFNGAQRGIFNTDEALPSFLMNTLLAGAVFGPVVVVVALLGVYGRITFGLGYTEGSGQRLSGFMPAMIAEGESSHQIGARGRQTLTMPWV